MKKEDKIRVSQILAKYNISSVDSEFLLTQLIDVATERDKYKTIVEDIYFKLTGNPNYKPK